ncbi:MAG TPA: hypothetical protein VHT73_05880 [Thermodesulfobacteriota bacterium]|nr:hypothetical protein [Thermodesulfobacteriota bacterium]
MIQIQKKVINEEALRVKAELTQLAMKKQLDTMDLNEDLFKEYHGYTEPVRAEIKQLRAILETAQSKVCVFSTPE